MNRLVVYNDDFNNFYDGYDSHTGLPIRFVRRRNRRHRAPRARIRYRREVVPAYQRVDYINPYPNLIQHPVNYNHGLPIPIRAHAPAPFINGFWY